MRALPFAWAAASILAAWGVRNAPDLETVLFQGGWRVGAYHAVLAAFAIFAAVSLVGAGEWVFRIAGCVDPPAAYRGPLRATVARFVAGAALANACGFLLGLAGWLRPEVCAALFLLGTVAFLRYFPLRGLAAGARRAVPDGFLPRLCLGAAAASVAAVFIAKVAVHELRLDDSLQLYVSFLDDVARTHSLIPDASRPRYVDFAVAKGSGAYFLLAALGNPYLGSLLGFFQLMAFAALAAALAGELASPKSSTRDLIVPLAFTWVCLALAGSSEFAKYHLQSALLLLFLTDLSRFAARRDAAHGRWYLVAGCAAGAALGLALPHAVVLAAAVLLSAGLLAWRSGEARTSWRILASIFAAVGAGAAVSFGVNWAVTGIPAFSPFLLFRKLILPGVFARASSEAILEFTLGIQSVLDPKGTWEKLSEVWRQWIVPEASVGFLAALFLASCVALIVTRRPSLGGAARVLLPWSGVVIALHWAAGGGPALLLHQWLAGAPLVLLLSGSLRDKVLRDYRPAVVALCQLGVYLWVALVLASGDGTMSATRFFAHLAAVRFILLLVPAVLILEKGWPRAGAFAAAALAADLIGAAAALTAPVPFTRYLEYAVGARPMLEVVPDRREAFEECRNVGRSLPIGARLLYLNSYGTLGFCAYSPLLGPGREIVHQYQSDVGIRFAELAGASGAKARRILKEMGIDYFFVGKGRQDFWGLGFSEAFSAASIRGNFDVYAEDPSFLILTWRGRGVRSADFLDSALVDGPRSVTVSGEGIYADFHAAYLRARDLSKRIR